MKDTSGFGRPLSTHRGTISAGGWLWYVGAVLVVAALLNLTKKEPALAAGALVGAIVALVPAVLRLKQTVFVFERGLVSKGLFGEWVLAAGETRGATIVRHVRRTGYYVEVRIALHDAATRSIVGVTDPEQLGSTIAAWGGGSTVSSPATAAAPAWAPPGASAR